MKQIIVFGATGRTGKYIVRYALQAGHQVTALVRDTSKLNIEHGNLSIVAGDVSERDKIDKLIEGKDVVISALGTNQIEGAAVNMMSDAMKIFVGAMDRYGVNRVLAIGGMGVLQLNETMQIIDKPDYPAPYKNVGEGHNKVYKVLKDTSLDWTFVCCPDIIDGPHTGKYRVKKNYLPEGVGQIFTGDLADFIIREMDRNEFVKTRVGINNSEIPAA